MFSRQPEPQLTNPVPTSTSKLPMSPYTVPIRPTRRAMVIKGSACRVFGQPSSSSGDPPPGSTYVIEFSSGLNLSKKNCPQPGCTVLQNPGQNVPRKGRSRHRQASRGSIQCSRPGGRRCHRPRIFLSYISYPPPRRVGRIGTVVERSWPTEVDMGESGTGY